MPFCHAVVPSYVTVPRHEGGGVKMVVNAIGGLVAVEVSGAIGINTLHNAFVIQGDNIP